MYRSLKADLISQDARGIYYEARWTSCVDVSLPKMQHMADWAHSCYCQPEVAVALARRSIVKKRVGNTRGIKNAKAHFERLRRNQPERYKKEESHRAFPAAEDYQDVGAETVERAWESSPQAIILRLTELNMAHLYRLKGYEQRLEAAIEYQERIFAGEMVLSAARYRHAKRRPFCSGDTLCYQGLVQVRSYMLLINVLANGSAADYIVRLLTKTDLRFVHTCHGLSSLLWIWQCCQIHSGSSRRLLHT